MFEVILTSIKNQKGKSILTFSAIILSTLGFIGFLSLAIGFQESLENYYTRLDGIYILEEFALDPIFSSVTLDTQEKLTAVEGVIHANPEIWELVSSIDNDSPMRSGLFSFVSLGGIDPLLTQKLPGGGVYFKSLTRGTILRNAGDIMISESVARDYSKNVSDTILINGEQFTICGIFETGSFFLDSSVLVHIEKAREMAGRSEDCVSSFYLALEPGTEETVIPELEKIPFTQVKQANSVGDDFQGVMTSVYSFTGVISVFILFISAIVIMNFMISSIRERKREYGIFLCEGWSYGDLFKMIIFETLILTAGGSIMGILLFLGITPLAALKLPFALHISPLLLISGFFLGTITGILGSIIPFWYLKRLNPAEILRSL